MTKSLTKSLALFLTLGASVAALIGNAPFAPAAPAADYKMETLAKGLDMPWSLVFLPNGDMLITELSGQLRLMRDGRLVQAPIKNVPKVHYAGQGGLMDIILHPDYEKNQWVYLSYSEGGWGKNRTKVIRARFTGDALADIKTIFEAKPYKDTSVHYGGRMAFMADGTLLINVGDGFDYREQAQARDNHYGKIARVRDDGSVPDDNPFVGEAGALPEIWTYGHRNAQALLLERDSGRVYQNEHGARGGDELNLIERGRNYGWPAITWGLDYSGAKISPYTALPGMEQPLRHWTPSIAPSGMTLYDGDLFPMWRGDLFITSLVFRDVWRVDMDDGVVRGEERLFGELGERLRDIRTGPDGALYILAEESGRLIRVAPR